MNVTEMDEISRAVLKVINTASEPLETKEVEKIVRSLVEGVTRSKLLYRLTMLRADGLINGKFVGPGKGVWVWWKKDAFTKE